MTRLPGGGFLRHPVAGEGRPGAGDGRPGAGEPPFFGTRIIRDIPVAELLPHLDTKTLFTLGWGLTGPNASDLARNVGEPRLRYWTERIQTESLVNPQVSYGYFPASVSEETVTLSEAEPVPERVASPVPVRVASPVPVRVASPVSDRVASPVPVRVASPVPVRVASPVPVRVASPVSVRVASPVSDRVASPVPVRVASPVPVRVASPVFDRVVEPVETTRTQAFTFPRQHREPHRCLADWIGDFLPVQLVTVGPAAVDFAGELYAADKYRDYFEFNALAAALAEALADYWHNQIRAELGIPSGQGERFSIGYPACPDLADRRKVVDLLQADKIGVALTEGYQLAPEYSTDALIITDPKATYFRA